MQSAIALYGSLLLAFLGIIVPLLSILLSLFRQGLSELRTRYENERKSSEENLGEQMKAQAGSPDIEAIQKIIDELKAKKAKAEKRLSFLNPKTQIIKLFILFFVSFLLVGVALLITKDAYKGVIVGLSFLLFLTALYFLWKLLAVVVEVKGILDDHRVQMETKVIELLSESSSFIENVHPYIEGKVIKDNKVTIDLPVNIKRSLKIQIVNNEKIMAKRVEFGLTFPKEFIVEKKPYHSIYTDESGSQIVRYNYTEIHGATNLIAGSLELYSIKQAETPIQVFIKGENIKVVFYTVLFRVI